MSQQTDHDTPDECREPNAVCRCGHNLAAHELSYRDDSERAYSCCECDCTWFVAAPPPTAAPEPPQQCGKVMGQIASGGELRCTEPAGHPGQCSVLIQDWTFYGKSRTELLRIINEHADLKSRVPAASAPTARPHRIGVWDYQSLCDCLKHNLEQAIPGYPYRDPQDAIQALAARVMTLQRYLDAQNPPK